MRRKRIAVVIGTRPEAIKMAPVIIELRKAAEHVETIVISTAQHRQMLDQILPLFNIMSDVDLNIMRHNQTLSDLTARVLSTVDQALKDIQPDILLVQGDTTTVLACALAAFYNHIPLGHIEAGLRSHDLKNPFPEEANRHLASVLTQIHFSPTILSRKNLKDEGVPPHNIFVTGNTVVDALMHHVNTPFDIQQSPLANIPVEGNRVILVTSHRRESWGRELHNICMAIKELVRKYSDVIAVYPVHMNPNVRQTVEEMLAGEERVFLTEPLEYLAFINAMKLAHIIVTDSGGVQEEAPSLRTPVLVLRKLTERPEAMLSGTSRVIGTSTDDIVQEVDRLLCDEQAYAKMATGKNPFGDGMAAKRIATALIRWCRGDFPLLDPQEQFMLSGLDPRKGDFTHVTG